MKECPYGLGCYRKRPEHFDEFSHPPEHKIANRFKDQKEAKSADKSAKVISKENISVKTSEIKEKEKTLSEKFGLYFTKVPGIKRYNP